MATGLTYPIYNGTDPSPRAFFVRCMGQFGAYFDLRDSSETPKRIEGEFDASPYEERVRRARAELDAVESRDDAWWDQEALRTNAANVCRNQQAETEAMAARHRYEKVLLEVEQWEPPTAEHQGYKDLMLSQLKSSMDTDCRALLSRTDLTGPELRDQRLEAARWSLDHAEKETEEARTRFESRKAWANAIWDTLDEVPA